MKVFFKKTANSLKDIKENPSLIRKKQIEEEARQIKMNVRQEFQKMENNKICDVESEAAQKFGLISEFDIINHLNDQKQQQLVELKRIQVELVEENKQKIRPKSRQNWNGQNTFNLTALQSQSVQRPSTSYQTKTQLYSKNSSIPEYFSVGLVKNHNAVEQRLEDIKGRYEAVNEEIFKEQQKQLEIVKMQDELNDKDLIKLNENKEKIKGEVINAQKNAKAC